MLLAGALTEFQTGNFRIKVHVFTSKSCNGAQTQWSEYSILPHKYPIIKLESYVRTMHKEISWNCSMYII